MSFKGLVSNPLMKLWNVVKERGQSLAEALHHYLEEGNTAIQPTLTKAERDGKTYFLPFPYLSKTGDSQSFETLSELLSALLYTEDSRREDSTISRTPITNVEI